MSTPFIPFRPSLSDLALLTTLHRPPSRTSPRSLAVLRVLWNMFRGHSAEDTRSDEEDENDLDPDADADASGDDEQDEKAEEGQKGATSTTAREVTTNGGGGGVRHRTGGVADLDDERIGSPSVRGGGGGGGGNGHLKADS